MKSAPKKKSNPDENSDEWCTSKEDADALGEFDLDPCSNSRSHIRARHTYDLRARGEDGLKRPWSGSLFWNGPYSNVLPWSERLAEYTWPWVALVKLDPTTRWWSTLMSGCSDWAPFNARRKFERPDKPRITANFPSALVWSRWKPTAAIKPLLWIKGYQLVMPEPYAEAA